MTDNVRHLPHPSTTPTHLELMQEMDRLLADIALDNPDLEPPGMHAAITATRKRYACWQTTHRHPSRPNDRNDGGGAA